MSFESADTHTFYQKDNLEQATGMIDDSILLIEETNLSTWNIWWAKKRLRQAKKYLLQVVDGLSIEEDE